MTLLELRKLFVERTGRYDLVTDYAGGDYSDNGADMFINAGLRWIDWKATTQRAHAWYRADIGTRDFKLYFGRARSIKEVWLVDEDGRTPLERKSLGWLRENYGSDLGTKAVGSATFQKNLADGDTLTVGSETYTFRNQPSGDYDVQIGSTASETAANLASKINSTSDDLVAKKVSDYVVRIMWDHYGSAGNDVVFTTTSGDLTLDGSGYLGGTRAGSDGSVDIGEPAYWAPLVVRPAPTQEAITEVDYDLYYSYDYHDVRYAGWQLYRGILWMPPADGTYTISVLGLFLSTELQNDSDSNFWTEVMPDLVIQAAAYKMEGFYRNREGAAAWREQAMDTVTDLVFDDVEEEIAGVNQIGG